MRLRYVLILAVAAASCPSIAGVLDLPNGVAAGDVSQNSAVLWARSAAAGDFRFDYSLDASFVSFASSPFQSVSDPTLPLKWQVTGLAAGSQYYYRLSDGAGNASTFGSFRTPAPAGTFAGVRFGVSGDWRGELAPYPAVKNIPSRTLDFFVKLGDTIYADFPSPALPQPQALSLQDFRIKHDEVLSARGGLNAWADVRRSTPVYATIDDHEVTNNFSGGVAAPPYPAPFSGPGAYLNQTPLYRTGLQAFHEYMPIQDRLFAGTGDARVDGRPDLYRAQAFGQDAAIFVTDARSFRDAPVAPVVDPTDPGQVAAFLASTFAPGRTMLGRPQVEQLKGDLLAAQNRGVTWKFVMVPEPMQNLGPLGAPDRYEGYAAERTELLSFIDARNIQNVVFVAADIHGTVVNDLKYQVPTAGGLASVPVDAWEITTGAVAFDTPFGATIARAAGELGLLSPAQLAFYNVLPALPDSDSNPFNDKDDFITALVNTALAQVQSGGEPLYDPVGLQGSSIPVELELGDYAVLHAFGWTEFEIDPDTQRLRVTTWGVPAYTDDQAAADPSLIAGLEPLILSRFSVTPVPEPRTWVLLLLGLAGVAALGRRRRRA